METKWLEDFVALAQTGSFSRAAQLRHVTQPAFSRRIQALEAWAGVDLVDRSSYPTRLTEAGRTLHAQALEMLQQLHTTRALLRQHRSAAHDTVELAVPHTLAFTFVPMWLSQLRARLGKIKTRLVALNVHDAVLRFAEGGCDLLLAYRHPSQPLELDAERVEMLPLGREVVAPFCRPGPDGQPQMRLPGSARAPVPYLAYAPGAYLARVVEWLLRQARQPAHLERVYETDMAESLKAMAIEGHGVAFLPISAVQPALADGRLVAAGSAPLWHAELDIHLYRARHRPLKPAAQQLWESVARGAGPLAPPNVTDAASATAAGSKIGPLP
ncbi:HTH-type transcriptional regulator YjiE [Tepidimonas alkaliphilus]|uniref:HTH-type transcriptional regulator YjiE n=1 Tax=Tepidimonas alkaliphilus TaxID=2588942 RepID=A0A554W7B5_9BURK|nr:LysR substrate-binding domain-containing protein [Tepidimonas alkaliphilus]TSE19459.1 HTH-type transcriptional regulator YjiE [Tepidimonas alkaliphilus]